MQARIMCAVAIVVALTSQAWGQCPRQWVPVSDLPGLNDRVYAMVVLDDGGGPALYVGGDFTTAGGVSANHIARWNGSSWSALGAGMNDRVNGLQVFDDGGGLALYAGGKFTIAGGESANHIAKWNGTIWSPLGTGMNGTSVSDLTVFDDGDGLALYAAGAFTTAGGMSANYIAKWDGSTWSALGTGANNGMNGEVNPMTDFDDGGGPALYAGGPFTAAGGVNANHVAKWNGTTWSALGTEISGGISGGGVGALTVFNDGDGPALFVGGNFTAAGGVGADNIAKWNGSSWAPLTGGMNAYVGTLTVFDDGGGSALYAGGSFTTAGGANANYVAKWNGSNWSGLGTGMNDEVYGLTDFDDGSGPALYAGGNFTLAGGGGASYIAKWACVVDPPIVGDDLCVGGSNSGAPCGRNSDCIGGFCQLKNRFITAVIPATATTHGIKVTLVNIGADSVATPSNYDGTDRWVGAPALGISDGAGFPSFNAAKIQCAFQSMDWSTVGQLHMYGDVIVPGSTYDVSMCSAASGPCSTALRIGTAKFGDVIAPVNTVNFSDAFSIVATLQGAPTRPSKTRSDLVAAVLTPSNANAVNFSDVGACVSALQSKKFREVVTAAPATCP